MAKIDRQHYLLTIYNILFLNQKELENGEKEYVEVFGSRFIPRAIINNSCLCKLYVWTIVLFYPFILLPKFIKACFDCVATDMVAYSKDRIFLLATIALPRVAKNANIIRVDDNWLLLPWVDNDDVSTENKLSVFNFLSLKEVITSYFDSIRILYIIGNRWGYKYLLISVKSFFWFLYDKAIRHIPENVELIFANHKDNYSPLFENLPHKKKTLIQHGTEICMQNAHNIRYPLYLYSELYGFWVNNMPYKYSTITKLYCFSKKERAALGMSVLKCEPVTEVVGYCLKDFNANLEGEKAVLIVGYYELNHDLEERVISLLQGSGIKIYLKNHPLFQPDIYVSLEKKYNFNLLNGPVFPKADVLFTYDSTLALEYGELGVPVIYYNNLDKKALERIVSETIKLIKLR